MFSKHVNFHSLYKKETLLQQLFGTEEVYEIYENGEESILFVNCENTFERNIFELELILFCLICDISYVFEN